MAREMPPPYYAVIFTSQRTDVDAVGYRQTAARMEELARQQPGFLGIESARGDDGAGITVSYWESSEAIAAWKRTWNIWPPRKPAGASGMPPTACESPASKRITLSPNRKAGRPFRHEPVQLRAGLAALRLRPNGKHCPARSHLVVFPFRRPFPPPPIRNILGEAQCRHLAQCVGGNREKSNFSAPRDAGPAEITSRKLEPAQTVF